MGKIKFGVIVFPGSNCDHDAHYASGQLAGQDSRLIWHKESSLGDVDVVIVPGGFCTEIIFAAALLHVFPLS